MELKNEFPNWTESQPQFCISGRIMKCSRIITRVFRKHIQPYGATTSQMSILFNISKRQPILQSELTEVLQLERSTISRDLTRLIQKGFIEKTVEGGKTILNMRKQGFAYLEGIIPAWDRAMKEIREKLGEDGEEALGLLLHNLSE